MKILITGGAGYIGSILVPMLLDEGHQVTVIDNFMYRQASLLDCCYNSNFKIIRGDARDKSLLINQLKDTDLIIPLACLVGAPLCSQKPLEAKSINHDAVSTILKLRSKNQMIIFPTTNSGYGIGQAEVYCTEETPLLPVSLYGKLKVEIEKELLDAENTITLRLATVFGMAPRMRLDLLVNDFTYRAVNDGFVVLYQAHFVRNYIHVRDVARVFLHCFENLEVMNGEPYNVGLSDANLSKWQLCQEIQNQLPDFCFVEAEVGEDPDKRNYLVSNEKIEATGFEPIYSLQFGITELIKGYQILKRNQYANY